jgi:hypothetical protein
MHVTLYVHQRQYLPQSDISFFITRYSNILSCLRAGLVSQEFFKGEEGTGGSEMAADIRDAALGQSTR